MSCVGLPTSAPPGYALKIDSNDISFPTEQNSVRLPDSGRAGTEVGWKWHGYDMACDIEWHSTATVFVYNRSGKGSARTEMASRNRQCK